MNDETENNRNPNPEEPTPQPQQATPPPPPPGYYQGPPPYVPYPPPQRPRTAAWLIPLSLAIGCLPWVILFLIVVERSLARLSPAEALHMAVTSP